MTAAAKRAQAWPGYFVNAVGVTTASRGCSPSIPGDARVPSQALSRRNIATRALTGGAQSCSVCCTRGAPRTRGRNEDIARGARGRPACGRRKPPLCEGETYLAAGPSRSHRCCTARRSPGTYMIEQEVWKSMAEMAENEGPEGIPIWARERSAGVAARRTHPPRGARPPA